MNEYKFYLQFTFLISLDHQLKYECIRTPLPFSHIKYPFPMLDHPEQIWFLDFQWVF